jgi:predicted enzyme related to lactoylglutathione lyase
MALIDPFRRLVIYPALGRHAQQRWSRTYEEAPEVPRPIMVDTIAATLKAVVANGGKIVQPMGMDAPEKTARFSDPAGNVLGLGEIGGV